MVCIKAPCSRSGTATGRPRADRDGIVVVYPQGIDSTWNIGVGSPDVAYFGQLLDETEAALCIDTNRVYVDGFSLGAFLTSAIVCTYADRIAAVAPIAGIYMPVRLHTGASGSRAHDPRDARQLGRVHVDPGEGRGVGGTQRLRRDADHRNGARRRRGEHHEVHLRLPGLGRGRVLQHRERRPLRGPAASSHARSRRPSATRRSPSTPPT